MCGPQGSFGWPGTNPIANCCSGARLPSAQHLVPAGDRTDVLLFSAMGVGAGAHPLAEGCVQQLSVGSDTGQTIHEQSYAPSSLGIWSEDARYGKGKRWFPRSVKLRLELCGSAQAQHNRGQSPPRLFSPAQELQPHRPTTAYKKLRHRCKSGPRANGSCGVLAPVLSSCQLLPPANIWPLEDIQGYRKSQTSNIEKTRMC